MNGTEGLVERLRMLSVPREYAASDISGPAVCAEAAQALDGMRKALETGLSEIRVVRSCMETAGFLRNEAGYLTDAALWLERADIGISQALSTPGGEGEGDLMASVAESARTGPVARPETNSLPVGKGA